MDILEQLTRDEGYKQFPYDDTVGKLTIGIGFNLADVGLSLEESQAVLGLRIAKLTAGLAKLDWYATLDEVRQGVVKNLAYALGIGGLLHFPSMIHYLTIGDWNNAAAQLLASKWATQVGERAKRLALQLQTGVWV